MALVSREGSALFALGLPVAAYPRGVSRDSTVGWEGGGLGTAQDCHSKLGFQHRNPGTHPTPAGGQTGMGDTDSNSWDRVGVHLIWYPKPRSKADR